MAPKSMRARKLYHLLFKQKGGVGFRALMYSVLILGSLLSLSQADNSCTIHVWPSIEPKVFHKFEYASSDEEDTVRVHGGEGCHLRIFAVGGGGAGCECPTGGGSGFIQYIELPIPRDQQHPYHVKVSVGNGSFVEAKGSVPGQPSSLSVEDLTNCGHRDCSRVAYAANPGQDCYYDRDEQRHHGGNGYSGGGGWCSGNVTNCPGTANGGSSGGPGHAISRHGVYGRGTGEDLALFRMENFVITPGRGGDQACYPSCPECSCLAGGGGGVIVDGISPPNNNNLTLSGEGYGGGEGRCAGGKPGIILMEVGPKIHNS